MFQLHRRASTILILGAATIGSGLAVSPASASPARPGGPSTTIATAPGAVEPVGLLLPAVQAAREAAARISCSR